MTDIINNHYLFSLRKMEETFFTFGEKQGLLLEYRYTHTILGCFHIWAKNSD
jgi:hypothetical protein